jgi:alpha-glucuronidase
MDRTVATGTGFAGQYSPAVAALYESVASCPDDLLLFMHHVPYTHVLHDGKTVIQYLYDAHYDGAAAVEATVREWNTLAGRVDEARYRDVLAQLTYQAGQAIVWRDAVSNWFLRASGIPDAKGRVGHHPGRLEAEGAELSGYVAAAVMPWEAASGGTAVQCRQTACTARFTYHGASGPHDIAVQYFDLSRGASKFRVTLGAKVVAEWTADDQSPTRRMVVDGSSSARHVIANVVVQDGDVIVVDGTPDGGETAALDYVEVEPVSH